MRALVTGGNRYIGVHLLFELARRGHEVTVVNSHVGDMPEGCRRIHADRTVPGALFDALAPHRDEFDIVFDNTAYRVADLEPMIELFEGRVSQFVFTSSVAVYRRSFVQPVREEFRRHDPADPDPRKRYGAGKVACEDHLRALVRGDRVSGNQLARHAHAGSPYAAGDTRADHLQAARGAAADLRARRRLSVRAPRARAGRRRADGLAVRLGSCRRPDLQRRRLRVHEHRRLHPHDGQGGGRRARDRARPDGHCAAGGPAAPALGRGHHRRRHLLDRQGTAGAGLAAGVRPRARLPELVRVVRRRRSEPVRVRLQR